MASFQVTCHTPDEMDVERRIRGLGGQGWWFPIEAIIEILEKRQHEFWVSVGKEQVELAIGRHGEGGRKFLTTAEGQFPPKDLLNLPTCSLTEGPQETSERNRWATVP